MNDITTVPEPSAVPKTGDLPKWYPDINNIADQDEVVEKFAGWARSQCTRFDGQTIRQKWCKTGGRLDIADKMERCSLTKDENSEQTLNTKSNMPSTIAFDNARTIYSNLAKIFGYSDSDDLPGEFEPEQDPTIYRSPADGQFVADQQNMLERHTFDMDERKQKGLEHLWSLVKYGNLVVWDEWERCVERIRDKKVTKFTDDEDRLPVKWSWEMKDMVTKDCPSLTSIDLKDAFFDCNIDDEKLWRAFFFRGQKPWDILVSEQKQGYLKNVEKITPIHFYSGEDGSLNRVLADRLANAGEDGTPDATGLVRVWQEWGYVPISENDKGKATWNPKRNMPQLYWGTFAGDLLSGKQICLRLIKCPNNLMRIPVKMVHLLRDDKGAFHDGLFTRTEALYWQSVTNKNQANDNVNLINLSPWWTNGIVKPRNFKFRANMLLQVSPGAKLEQLKVDNQVPTILNLDERTERNFEKTTGADSPISGEIAFSRTTATQSQNSQDQALLPIDDMAAYVANQYIKFQYEWDAVYWRQYGDPKSILSITHNNLIHEVKPANLYGPLKIAIKCVTRFRNNRSRRIELNNLAANVWPSASQDSTPEGRKVFWRWLFTEFKIDVVNEVFPMTEDFDAYSIAMAEVQDMLEQGEWVEPLMEQNQNAHLAVERSKLAQYMELPNDDPAFSKENAAMLKLHIQMEEDFLQQKAGGMGAAAQAGQAQGEGMEQQEQPNLAEQAALPGETTGSEIAAEAGGEQ